QHPRLLRAAPSAMVREASPSRPTPRASKAAAMCANWSSAVPSSVAPSWLSTPSSTAR
ncbi:hypothetical protein BN1723_020397, partial [Verticillium longisporum]